MEQYVILARSVTYAQRMQKLLGQAGIRCQISRAPRDLTDLGCAYILRLDEKNVAQALTIFVFSYHLRAGIGRCSSHDLF